MRNTVEFTEETFSDNKKFVIDTLDIYQYKKSDGRFSINAFAKRAYPANPPWLINVIEKFEKWLLKKAMEDAENSLTKILETIKTKPKQ